MKKQLYPWQEECLQRWFADNGRGMVQAVTGSGKTLLALSAMERLEKALPRTQELRVKIVVPTAALMRQWERAMREFLTDPDSKSGGNATPEAISDPISETIPKCPPKAAPQNTSECLQEAAPQNTSECLQEAAPQNTPECLQEAAPQNTPECLQEAAPQNTPKCLQEAAPQNTLAVMPASLPGSHTGISRKTVGLRGAGHNAPADCRYMIYVINSARYELARRILSDLREGAAVLLIADECHRYVSSQNRLIFEFLSYAKLCEGQFFSLGLSATLPSGEDGAYLASVLGRKIYSYGMKQAAAMRTVCRYDVFHIALSFRPEEQAEYDDVTEQMTLLFRSLLRACPWLKYLTTKELFEELRALTEDKNRKIAEAARSWLMLSYKRKHLVCLASSRISCACSLIERLPSQDKIFIFGERIAQADELYQKLRKRFPGKVGRFHSQMSPLANRNALNRFRDGEIRILIACKSMDEGIDVPDASVGIILSGTSVQRQRIQRLGRIIRKADDKKRAALYYLHLSGTTEERCFLTDQESTPPFELSYCSDSSQFTNPPYDQASEALMNELVCAGANKKVLEEAERCLRLGAVRADWAAPSDMLEHKINAQNDIMAKNYWLCMKKLQKYLPS